MNVDFNGIPDWVCWLAQDEDGSWWGYEAEPNLSHISWYENEVGRSIRLKKEQENLDWISTLQKFTKHQQVKSVT